MKRYITLLSILTLLLVQGCHPDPFLTVSPTDLSFGQDGGSQTVKVSANYPWTASASGAGITVSPSSGEGDATVTISVASATTTSEMSGSVSFRSEGLSASVSVKQDAKSAIIVGDVARIPFEGGTFRVDIQYNTDYNVEIEKSAQSWITFNGTKAMSNSHLEFIFAENEGAERSGKVTVTDKSGNVDPVTITFVQEGRPLEEMIKGVLMDIYNALDGPNWKKQKNWGTDQQLINWEGVTFDSFNGELSLFFNETGLKGEIPDCIGDLGGVLVRFGVSQEPGLEGTLPESFRKLTNLRYLEIQETSMTSLPDVFADMASLEDIYITDNLMSGPIPESLDSSPVLRNMYLGGNYFTGGVKASWVRLGNRVVAELNCLSGEIPQEFIDSEYYRHFFKAIFSHQREGYYFDITNIDVPGFTCWPEEEKVEDLDGNVFSFLDVIRKNRYTVYLNWGPWCPFSKALMPQLRDYYEQYRQDGLEIIATIMLDENGDFWNDFAGQKQEVADKGYDQWYNFYYWSFPRNSYLLTTPAAEVYDSDGYLLFSCLGSQAPDPVRHRYGKRASTDLIPFLETLLGPAEPEDPYESTDYSKDGEVMTLQTATVGGGINIVFMGDGYTDRDMGAGGLYETLMDQAMEEFFAIEPYKTFRNRFNVYAVKVVSQNGRIGADYTTALGSRFGTGTYIGGNNEKVYEYALKVPGITDRNNLLVGVLANTKRQAGTTFMSASSMSSVAFIGSLGNDPVYFGPTLRHEVGGHGFGFLDDEYVVSQSAAPQGYIDDHTFKYEEYGWFANVDFTADPAKVKWSAFLSDERYKDEVGLIEGAYYATGVWRSSKNSMMRENMEYFNAPSRWAIYKRIMELSGEEYNFKKFLEYDAVNRKSSQAQSSVKPPLKAPGWKPGAPPVIVR